MSTTILIILGKFEAFLPNRINNTTNIHIHDHFWSKFDKTMKLSRKKLKQN